ncbi:MAG: PilZ domain-containing protein [Terriglobia bacterium]
MPIKSRILIIDADPAARQLIFQALIASEVEPHAFAAGRKAAELVGREKYDGIFLDWTIPDMAAEELVRQIRRSKWNHAAPIIAMADEHARQAITESFKVGVTFFLGKPLSASKVQRLLTVSRGLILEERRQFQRVRVSLPMECQHDQDKRTGISVDLSARGARVKTKPAYPAESYLELGFELPAKPEVTVRPAGRVVRVTPEEEMGIQFLKLSAEERRQITDFVEEILQKFPRKRKS